MSLFAELSLDPGGIVAWLVVGLLAGLLAGWFMRGSGYGLIGDIVVGLIGAVVGGFFSGMFVTGTYGFGGSILISFLGACALIWLVRMVASRREYK